MDELLNEDVIELAELTEEEQHFMVDDDQKAEWCIRKIAEARKEMMDWIEFYVAQTDKVKDKCERRIQFFQAMLEKYFYTVPHKQAKTQSSYQLPSGKLIMKAQGPDYERDEAQLLPWVKTNAPEMVKVKESVDWSGLKKSLETADGLQIVDGHVITPDGEILPGVNVVERPNIFKVEVK